MYAGAPPWNLGVLNCPDGLEEGLLRGRERVGVWALRQRHRSARDNAECSRGGGLVCIVVVALVLQVRNAARRRRGDALFGCRLVCVAPGGWLGRWVGGPARRPRLGVAVSLRRG